MKSTLPHGFMLLAWAAASIGLSSCAPPQTANPEVTRVPANPTPGKSPTPLFEDVAGRAGLHYRWTIGGKRPLNILQSIGNGCAFLDYDNDGSLDILLVGPRLALFRGDGRGHFTDVSAALGLDRLSGRFLGCAVGDYDNDGYEDLYISAYRGGVLLHNEKGRGYRDVTPGSGLASQPWGTSCAFGDIDSDGRLDLYIANYVVFGPQTQPQLCKYSNQWGACGPRFYAPLRGALYRNEGNGHFRDVTRAWAADQVSGKALGAAFADFDGSGRQSLAIANDEAPGDLLQNRGARFENVGARSGTAYDHGGSVHGGMGIDWADYDNDGRLDLAVATFQNEPKSIYHNDGRGFFTETSSDLGLADATTPMVAFGIKWLDYDNDGWSDLVLSNGHVQDNIDLMHRNGRYREPLQLFHNARGHSFTDASALAGPAFQRLIVGRGLATGDFDNDGRVDILAVDGEGSPLLLHNQAPGAGHWLSVKLTGARGNRDGIGARITVKAGSLQQLRQCTTAGSYLSASDRRVHFGLGSATTATLSVHWPGGAIRNYPHIPVDRTILLREDSPDIHVL